MRGSHSGRAVRLFAAIRAFVVAGAICWSIGCGSARSDGELIALFESEGAAWIRAERARYRPLAAPLSEADRRRFSPYFPQELLEKARLLEVSGFENPAFFSIFEDAGEARPLDLRQASALALVDTIVITESASASSSGDQVLFHELVHLVQYEAMGLDDYMRTYAESWAENGRSYRAIRHEVQAFELASRFAVGEPFSVQTEVATRFADTVGVDRGRENATERQR